MDGMTELTHDPAPTVADTAARIGALLGAAMFFAGILIGVAMSNSFTSDPISPVVGQTDGVVATKDTIRADSAFLALADRLEAEEGYRSHPYDDSQGHLTIGYGTNLEVGITKQEARLLLESRLADAMDCFEKAWPPFPRQPAAIQLALADAAYQLGCAGLTSFRRFLAALDGGHLPQAVEELRSSRWYEETPDRVERLIEVVRRES